MSLALLIDFGSTFTKVVAVDLQREEVAATAKAPTTVAEGIRVGLKEALTRLQAKLGQSCDFELRLACSSAAGGLKMVAIGLVKDLTAEAARRAALGAGARVLDVFSYELTDRDRLRIQELEPDIILLAGGTDGGNKDVILHNARQLAGLELDVPVVVAGNRAAADEVYRVLTETGKEAVCTENVMPEVGQLNVESARKAIRQVFLERIVAAKGLKSVEELVDGVLMPTPAAVLEAGKLLATGVKGEVGIGELVILDVGGATTDVHSVAKGLPSGSGVTVRGLPEPFAKRTVEGDLGVRYNAPSVLEAIGGAKLAELAGIGEEEVRVKTGILAQNPACLPVNPQDARLDQALARAAVEVAMVRHAGKYEVVYSPMGSLTIQRGKDLTGVKTVIGTGGVVVNSDDPTAILKGAMYSQERPYSLCPKEPQLLVDTEYILAAVGLLAEREPLVALHVLKKSLRLIGDREGNVSAGD